MLPEDPPYPYPRQRSYFLVCAVVAALAVLLIIYSQTLSFAWDEGFHMLTAQLIMRGKRPYLDWLFPQTLLNAYWNALWMRIFGDTWRTAHAAAAVMASGALWMTADYLYTRFPAPGWRLPAALTGTLSMGLNAVVVDFGTVGQAYGFCLFLMVAAFRLTIASVDSGNLLLAAAAGFFAGAGPAASLLTTWVCPVLAVWMFFQNRAGSRWFKLSVFAVAAVIPFAPELWMFAQNPGVTKFNVLDYHLLYRQVHWDGAIAHDMAVMMAWADSGDALLLGLLAVAGLLFVRFHSTWSKSQRAEFYLCGAISAALALQIASAHPNFTWYYLLTAPFLSILAAAGLYWINGRLYREDRPQWAICALTFVLAVSLARYIVNDWDSFRWTDLEGLAKKVDEVTPPNGRIFGDEQIFFITRRPPPSGLELADSHKLEMSPALAAERHVLTGSELQRQVRAGRFDTVQICGADDRVKDWGIDKMYHQKAEIEDCVVFWSK